MKRTYAYRLYPRRRERVALEAMLEQGREVYNAALQQCIQSYKADGQRETALGQWAYFRAWRKQPGITLNASSLQHILRRLDKAYSAFFRRLKAGETPGQPRFKGEKRFSSLEYTYGDGCKLRHDPAFDRQVLYVQNVGDVKVKQHRPLPEQAAIRYVVLKRKASGWYVHLLLDLPDPEPVNADDRPAVGADAGLLRLLTLSDGTQIDNPRWLRSSLRQLRVAQRRLARRTKGSQRRANARQQVALLHEHVANTRRDFWHKTTTRLVNAYRAIAVEGLNLTFMLRNGHLSLSAHDAGLGLFYALLDSKAEKAGCLVVRVDPASTSQVCSACGCVVEKALSVRVHVCPPCSLTMDRDENAARNIFRLAFESARTEPSGAKVDHRVVPSLRSSPL